MLSDTVKHQQVTNILKLMPKNVEPYLRRTIDFILIESLKSAAKEQGLIDMAIQLEGIVPDIINQYTTFKVDNTYIRTKVRNQHAFQVSLVNKVMAGFRRPVIVDIGDSSGTHIQYIIGIHSNDKNIRCLSVNLDAEAVKRVRKKGMEAIHARAEDLHNYNIDADVFLCFETLEHLMNPCYFLHELSTKTKAKYLIVTVPYLTKSRVGLHHMRTGRNENVYAENTHIFELSPEDWRFIVKHSGWDIVEEKIYLQYPKKGLWYITRPIWRRMDYEGFYGLILKRDDSWSSKYLDW